MRSEGAAAMELRRFPPHIILRDIARRRNVLHCPLEKSTASEQTSPASRRSKWLQNISALGNAFNDDDTSDSDTDDLNNTEHSQDQLATLHFPSFSKIRYALVNELMLTFSWLPQNTRSILSSSLGRTNNATFFQHTSTTADGSAYLRVTASAQRVTPSPFPQILVEHIQKERQLCRTAPLRFDVWASQSLSLALPIDPGLDLFEREENDADVLSRVLESAKANPELSLGATQETASTPSSEDQGNTFASSPSNLTSPSSFRTYSPAKATRRRVARGTDCFSSDAYSQISRSTMSETSKKTSTSQARLRSAGPGTTPGSLMAFQNLCAVANQPKLCGLVNAYCSVFEGRVKSVRGLGRTAKPQLLRLSRFQLEYYSEGLKKPEGCIDLYSRLWVVRKTGATEFGLYSQKTSLPGLTPSWTWRTDPSKVEEPSREIWVHQLFTVLDAVQQLKHIAQEKVPQHPPRK